MSGWTEAEDRTLRRLWVEGKSAGEIAKALRTGRSRNAVIGRVHRLGMGRSSRAISESRRTSVVREPRAPKVARNTANRPPVPGPQNKPGAIFGKITILNPEKADARRAMMRERGQDAIRRATATDVESPNAVPLLEHRTGCRWPLGERGAIRFCCNPVMEEGRPYCVGHWAVSISKDQPGRIKEPREVRPKAVRQVAETETPWDFGREAA